MDINCIIGIDPGRSGGIAVYCQGAVKAIKIPKDFDGLRIFLEYYRDNFRPVVFLEKLCVRPDDIGTENKMGKMFRIQKMLSDYEHIKALLEFVGIPYVMVHPASWQAKLGLRLTGIKEEKAARKNRYKRFAQVQYPQVRVSLWNADALLIMHFGRWSLQNNVKWVKANLPEREYQKLF